MKCKFWWERNWNLRDCWKKKNLKLISWRDKKNWLNDKNLMNDDWFVEYVIVKFSDIEINNYDRFMIRE